MKIKLFDSIRMKLVLAMLFSLLCTVLTDILVMGGIYLVKYAAVRDPFEQSVKENYIDKSKTEEAATAAEDAKLENGSNFGTSNKQTDKEAVSGGEEEGNDIKPPEYEPNEYVPDRDRIYTLKIRYRGIITPYIWLDMLILLIFSCFLFFGYYVAFTNYIIMYFNEINRGIERIQNGDMDTAITVRGGDELSEIADSINHMKYELKKSMESERQSEQMKNELVTNVAHDLRTPLTSTIGYLELLHRGEFKDEESRKKYTEVAYQKAKTLETLINELFDYTRFQKGKVGLNLMPLDITMFLAQLIEEFRLRIEEENLTCITDIPKEPIMIEADGDKLARAFSNLLTNAVKYGADGKQIKLSLIDLEDQVYVSITNYGKVIPQQDLPYVFDKFYRVEQSRNKKTGGTGLGLAIAKNIVLMHNGEISAKSDEMGTVFIVCLLKSMPKEPEEGTENKYNKIWKNMDKQRNEKHHAGKRG